MSLLLTAAEMESLVMTGSNQLVNTTSANKFDPDYPRMSLAHSGAPLTAYMSGSFTGVTELWLHFEMGIELTNSGWDSPFVRLVDSVSGNTVLQIDGDNGNMNMEYWNGASFTSMTPAFNLPNTTVRTVDIHCKIHDTLGRFALYFDNVLFLEFTGDTNLFASAQVDGIELAGGHNSSTATHEINYSEIIVADEPTLGWRCATIVPDADGTTSAQWTGSFADIDEITNSDSDLLTSGSANDLETMRTTNLSTPAAALSYFIALVTVARAQRGASGPTQFQFALNSNVTDYFSASIALASGVFSEHSEIWATDPDTAAAWTAANIDAVELGVKSIA